MEKDLDIIYKFQIFENQAKQIKEQMEVIEQTIIELNSLYFGLDDLKDSKEKEVFALIGKGIYAKAKIISEELLVNIGDKNFVKKDINSTKRIIEKQIEKMQKLKEELNDALEVLNKEITEYFLKYKKEG